MANSIPIICFFNGRLSTGVNCMPIYEGGSRKMFMLSKSYNFDEMTKEIHRVTKINKEEYVIKVFFNCPINESRTIAVEITDDDELNDMKQLVEKQVSIELFIEQYPIQQFAQVSRPIGEFSRMLDLDNESSGFMTSPSQEPWSQVQYLSGHSLGGTSSAIYNDASGHVTCGLPPGSNEEEETNDDSEDIEEGGVQVDSMHVAIGIDDDSRWVDQFHVNNDYVEAEDPLPDEFHNEDWINSSQAEVVDVGPNFERPEDFTFKKGDLFENKEALIFAIREWSIKNRVKFKPVKTNATSYHVRCYFNEKSGVEHASGQDERNAKCPWLLNAAVRKSSNGQFVISSYCGLHTCCNPTVDMDHYSASSSYICKLIMPEVRAELDLNAGQIMQRVYDMRGIRISKYKAYDARRKALSKIFGDWEKSYELLPQYLEAIKRNNQGTEYEIMSEEIAPGIARFTRVFWSFGPAIKGFTFCRPLLSIDGTHLYGKYKGVLLVATGVDANGSLFSLAFAVVEVEDTSSWKWFFELIYKLIPSVRTPRVITFISDRMKGIIRALHEGFGAPHHHRYCLRHIRDNFKKKHGDINLQNLLWQAGCATDALVYEHCREKIKTLSLEAHNWIEHNLKPQFEHRWALCKDGGVRFCMMTTNCSESFNGVLKGARAMPIQSLVARTFYRLNTYFNKRRADGVDWTTHYTPTTSYTHVIQGVEEDDAETMMKPDRHNHSCMTLDRHNHTHKWITNSSRLGMKEDEGRGGGGEFLGVCKLIIYISNLFWYLIMPFFDVKRFLDS